MSEHAKHEHAAKKLREAALRVHRTRTDEEISAALSELGYWRNEWRNSIPRDSQMMPPPPWLLANA